MAKFGAKFPVFRKDGETEGMILGKLVTANLTVNLASGELYADDMLAEQASEFASGNIAMETDDMLDGVAAEIFGATIGEDGEVIYKSSDTAPYGELAYYKVLMRGGEKSWQGYYYPKVRAVLGNDNAQTKGSSITFQTTSVSFVIFPDDDTAVWRETESFETEAEASAWCESKAGVPVVITLQPADVTAAANSPVSFHVEATGGQLSYLWQVKTSGSGSWSESTSPTKNEQTLRFSASASYNGRQYRCVVTNANGSATSEVATLTVE